jgi:hypothetical protein
VTVVKSDWGNLGLQWCQFRTGRLSWWLCLLSANFLFPPKFNIHSLFYGWWWVWFDFCGMFVCAILRTVCQVRVLLFVSVSLFLCKKTSCSPFSVSEFLILSPCSDSSAKGLFCEIICGICDLRLWCSRASIAWSMNSAWYDWCVENELLFGKSKPNVQRRCYFWCNYVFKIGVWLTVLAKVWRHCVIQGRVIRGAGGRRWSLGGRGVQPLNCFCAILTAHAHCVAIAT